jgi:hypothetical protein
MLKSDWHQCHFCGEDVKDGKDPKGNRHWLSDCRPDLVQHEPGKVCTWASTRSDLNCYAYQRRSDNTWTSEHEHFYPDGPM